MKKRAMSIAAALVLVVSMLFAAMDVSASGVTAQEGGSTDIRFSNGYQGYCLDYNDKVAAVNDEFSISDAKEMTHNTTGNNVSKQIKAIWVLYFEELYEEDGLGGYKLISRSGYDAASIIQSVIWHLTDDRYINGVQQTIYDGVMAYTGPDIPDEGKEITLSNGDKIVFSFMTLESAKSGVQTYIGFTFDVNPAEGHIHNYSENWESNGDKHWKECSCGDKTEEGFHEGGEATCTDKPICEKCETPYGTTDPENHVGETEVRDALEPTEEEPGYTGDTYCKSCETLLEEGSEIPPLGGSSGEDEEGTTEGEEETTTEGEEETTTEGEEETTTEGEEETTTEGEEETTTEETEGTTSETDEGATSEKEEAPAVNNEDSGPDTGDKSMIWTYLAVIVISFAGCVIGFVKKKNSNI